VAFFTRILDFKKTFLSKLRDKRSNVRFPVGTAFPLKASLLLAGDGSAGKKSATSGLSWSGPLGNISANGLSIFLSPAAQTVRGEVTTVHLNLGEQKIEIPCVVAHFRIYGSYAVCGLELKFKDFNVQKSYHQIVEAVSVGSSFASTAKTTKSESEVSQQWRSLKRSMLTEWRHPATRKVERFELAIGDHRLTCTSTPPTLKVAWRTTDAKDPVPHAVAKEVRDYFYWVTANMPKCVPADLRDLIVRLTQASTVKEAWAAPVKRPAS